MVETVPKAVVLSDIISPMAIKPVNVTLDFSPNGSLILTGTIRVSYHILTFLKHCLTKSLDAHSF